MCVRAQGLCRTMSSFATFVMNLGEYDLPRHLPCDHSNRTAKRRELSQSEHYSYWPDAMAQSEPCTPEAEDKPDVIHSN